MPDPTLTDRDIARLLTFATLHSGHMPDVSRGVFDSFERLNKNWPPLVVLHETQEELQSGNVAVYYEARITPVGARVAEAMLAAAAMELRR